MRFVFGWSFVLSVALIMSNIFSVMSCDVFSCDNTFNQLGQDLDDWEGTTDYWRYRVSLSWDGQTVAVLSPPKSDGSRRARVYTLDHVSSSWIQKGQDLDGDYEDVDTSTNGNVVALGGSWSTSYLQPPVFKYNGNTWERMGDESAGTDLTLLALSGNGMVIASSGTNLVAVHEYDGTAWSLRGQGIEGIADSPSVAISWFGSVLAIGESNQVRVYEYEAGSNRWEQRGEMLTGTGRFGHAVSMDLTGTWLAVGAPDYNFRGMVSFFRYNGMAWNTLGSPLYGTQDGESFGFSLEMSGAGDRIAVGSLSSCFSARRVASYQYELGGTWVQKGEDLYGEDIVSYSFQDVALSGNGSIVASGAPYHGTDIGLVRVYEAVPKPTETSPPVDAVVYTFDQLGQDIDGKANGVWSGKSVALSSSGKIVAVGSQLSGSAGQVRVYKFEDESWIQMGQDIDGDGSAGGSVTLSASGEIVAIGAMLANDYYGLVRVFQYNGNKWEPLGGALEDIDPHKYLGSSIALSADGSVLASASDDSSLVHRYDGTAWKTLGQQILREPISGKTTVSLSSDGYVLALAEHYSYYVKSRVRVLKYDDGIGSWIPMGPNIVNAAKSDLASVSLSSDGTIVGVGNYNEHTRHGSVEVFEYNESANSWNPLGSPLYGNHRNEGFGHSLDLSSDGHKIVVGSSNYHVGCSLPSIGKVGVYQYDGKGTWLQVGDDVVGEAAGDESGSSVALSGDGTIFASGAPKNIGNGVESGNGFESGHVRVYQLGFSGVGWNHPDSLGNTQHDNTGVSLGFSLVSGEFYDYGTIFPSGGASGDPHFKTWSGESYDFHGLCDLVLLKNHDFNSGLGMDIHIRTKKMKQWSFISNAVFRIGEDVLEIKGDPNGKTVSHWINGVEGDKDELTNNAVLPHSISGFPIFYRRISSKQHEFMVDVSDDEKIVVKTWKELVRVDVHGATEVNFGKSLGLMGTFGKGLHMGRDGRTVLPDVDDFGQEWQVLASEPLLFHIREGSQAPEKCARPSSTNLRRRLAENTISFEQAMIACAVVDEADRDMCIFDVMATDDMEITRAY